MREFRKTCCVACLAYCDGEYCLRCSVKIRRGEAEWQERAEMARYHAAQIAAENAPVVRNHRLRGAK